MSVRALNVCKPARSVGIWNLQHVDIRAVERAHRYTPTAVPRDQPREFESWMWFVVDHTCDDRCRLNDVSLRCMLKISRNLRFSSPFFTLDRCVYVFVSQLGDLRNPKKRLGRIFLFHRLFAKLEF